MRNRFALFAWGTLAYNIAVILWGAYVRVSFSGDGCGTNWPLCNGSAIPLDASVETLVEFTHRLTSGVALLLVVAMLIWAFRAYPRGHVVRLGAVLSLVLIIIEALVGAGLVLLGLVAENASPLRAVTTSVHLVNTFLLVGALTLTGWWASGGPPLRLRVGGPLPWLFAAGFLGMLFLNISGGIAALGNTLFPPESLADGLRQDFDPASHFLLRLRIFHPVIAVVLGVYLIALALYADRRAPGRGVRRFALALTGLFFAQMLVGVVNLVLHAPGLLQVLHLLMADLVWITLVLTAAATFGQADQPAPRGPTLRAEARPGALTH